MGDGYLGDFDGGSNPFEEPIHTPMGRMEAALMDMHAHVSQGPKVVHSHFKHNIGVEDQNRPHSPNVKGKFKAVVQAAADALCAMEEAAGSAADGAELSTASQRMRPSYAGQGLKHAMGSCDGYDQVISAVEPPLAEETPVAAGATVGAVLTINGGADEAAAPVTAIDQAVTMASPYDDGDADDGAARRSRPVPPATFTTQEPNGVPS